MRIGTGWGRRFMGGACLLCLAGSVHGQGAERVPTPGDADSVRARVEQVVAWLDAPRYARAVGWDEHITLLYERLRGRAPTREELFLLRSLHEEAHLTRGMSLSFALREDHPIPTWEQCRSLPGRLQETDLVTDLERRVRIERIQAQAIDPVALSSAFAPLQPERVDPPLLPRVESVSSEPNESYEVYYGYLHAHTGFSDGEGTPLDAYTRARDVGLDFFAVTDHGELLLLWPWDQKWSKILRTADALNDPGTYVTLWGFEWSHPLLGHVNVINPPDFTEILSNFWMRDLYDWVSARPEAFGRFNHPGRQDVLGIEFQHMDRYAPAVRQMVGMEVWNGGRSFETYIYGSGWETEFNYWDEGNRAGWYLGPVGGQDNHSMNWGDGGRQRTAVLATSLTRRALLEAYRARRFYATEDGDLVLDVRCQGYPMGSRIEGGPRTLVVTASDDGGDSFEEVRLYRNGELFETRAVSGLQVDETFEDSSSTGPDYYYVIVRQTDDADQDGRNDEALSSPIWIDG